MASTTASAILPLTQTLLSRGHSPDSVSRIFSEKIQYRPFLLQPTSPSPAGGNARDARRQARDAAKHERLKKIKPKPLSARERRRLGLYDVPREGQKYAIFVPLRDLWFGYVRELLGNELTAGGPNAAAKLCSAEFHGAELEVSRSRCVSRVGVKGIVIKDAKFVFEVVTKENRVKTIPKEGTVFRFSIPPAGRGESEGSEGASSENVPGPADEARNFVFEVHGDQFLCRAPDRANRRFKAHFSKSL